MRTSILNIDILCALSYLHFDESCINKDIKSICGYLLNNNGQKLKELIFYNRLYSQNSINNLPLVYTDNKLLNDENSVKEINNIIVFLTYLKNNNSVNDYKLLKITNKSEKFSDSYNDFEKRVTGYKSLLFYSVKFNEYIFVIRGTNGSSQWLDNAKVISKNPTPSEYEAYNDFNETYKAVSKNNDTKFMITGHSKGGLTALMVGALLIKHENYKNVNIHTMYSPYLNYKRIQHLLNDNVDNLMNMVNSIEIDMFDIVSNIFLADNFFDKYKNKVYIVGNYKDNGVQLWQNHKPLNHIVRNGRIVVNNYFDINGNPIRSNENLIFAKIIQKLSNLVIDNNIEIVYPFLIAIMKVSKLIGYNAKKDFYEDDEKLKSDSEKNVVYSVENDEVYFNFEKMKYNRTQAYLTYKLFVSIIRDEILQDLFIELFEDKKIIKDIFKNDIIGSLISKTIVDFIKTFRNIEDSCCVNIELEKFDENLVFEYMTKDLLAIILHEQFNGIFEINHLKSMLKIIKNEINLSYFYQRLFNIIIETFEVRCDCSNKIVDDDIIESVKNVFIVK